MSDSNEIDLLQNDRVLGFLTFTKYSANVIMIIAMASFF